MPPSPRLAELNEKPFPARSLREDLFEDLGRPALRPLPQRPYEYAEWKKARVNIDYHVELAGHYYSVPYQLIKQPVELRITITRWRSSSRAAAWPRTRETPSGAPTPPSRPTCPRPIGDISSGRLRGS